MRRYKVKFEFYPYLDGGAEEVFMMTEEAGEEQLLRYLKDFEDNPMRGRLIEIKYLYGEYDPADEDPEQKAMGLGMEECLEEIEWRVNKLHADPVRLLGRLMMRSMQDEHFNLNMLKAMEEFLKKRKFRWDYVPGGRM